MLERFRDDDAPFATAEWRDVCIVTYSVPPELLESRVPEGLELETREGMAFVSLVGFDFDETRVWGVGWPGFRRFPEVNLRFYVRRGDRRGVVFVREFVPQPFVAWMAGVLYHEPYEATPIESHVDEQGERRSVRFEWSHGGGMHSLAVETESSPVEPEADGEDVRFNDLHWGFGTNREGRTVCYEVRHPQWRVYPVVDWEVAVDWAHVYGEDWGELAGRTPVSVQLAEGSGVEIYDAEEL